MMQRAPHNLQISRYSPLGAEFFSIGSASCPGPFVVIVCSSTARQYSPASPPQLLIPSRPPVHNIPVRLVYMGSRILCVGVDLGLLGTRQAVLVLSGYESTIATPNDVDKRLVAEPFDLVILSVQLGDAEKQRILSILPTQTKVISLERLVMPEELLEMVASSIG